MRIAETLEEAVEMSLAEPGVTIWYPGGGIRYNDKVKVSAHLAERGPCSMPVINNGVPHHRV